MFRWNGNTITTNDRGQLCVDSPTLETQKNCCNEAEHNCIWGCSPTRESYSPVTVTISGIVAPDYSGPNCAWVDDDELGCPVDWPAGILGMSETHTGDCTGLNGSFELSWHPPERRLTHPFLIKSDIGVPVCTWALFFDDSNSFGNCGGDSELGSSDYPHAPSNFDGVIFNIYRALDIYGEIGSSPRYPDYFWIAGYFRLFENQRGFAFRELIWLGHFEGEDTYPPGTFGELQLVSQDCNAFDLVSYQQYAPDFRPQYLGNCPRLGDCNESTCTVVSV